MTRESAIRHSRCSISESDGYAHYLKLWPKIFFGEVQIARNTTWGRVVSQARAACGSEDRLVKAVKGQLRKQWEATPQRITRLLRFGFNSDFVFQQISKPWGASILLPELLS